MEFVGLPICVTSGDEKLIGILDEINLDTQKIMLKLKNGSIRVLDATEIADLEVLDSLEDEESSSRGEKIPTPEPIEEAVLNDPSILNMGDPSILNMGAVFQKAPPGLAPIRVPEINQEIDPTVASQFASLSMGMSSMGQNGHREMYTWQQTQGILNGKPGNRRNWRSQYSSSPRRNDSRPGRNDCFQISAAEIEKDFDFEASNALFDKKEVFENINQDEEHYYDEPVNENERKFQHTESVLDEYNRQYGNVTNKQSNKQKPNYMSKTWRAGNVELEKYSNHTIERQKAYADTTRFCTKEMALASFATSLTSFLKNKLNSMARVLFLIGSSTISDLECVNLANFISRSVPECLIYLAPSCDPDMNLNERISKQVHIIDSYAIPNSIDLCVSTLDSGSKLDFEVWKNELDFTIRSSQIKRKLLVNPATNEVSMENVDWVVYSVLPGLVVPSVAEFYLVDCGFQAANIPILDRVISQLI